MSTAQQQVITLKTGTGLAHYDAMCKAIELCHRVDEAKEIRDRTRALEVYAREALNFESERLAAQIRIRAERRAGELTKAAKATGQLRSERDGKSAGKSPVSPRATPAQIIATLPQLGITRDQSSEWQKLASIPQKQFDEILDRPERPTTTGVLAAAGKLPKAPKIHCDVEALSAYGHISRFEKIIQRPAAELFGLMQDFQQEHLVGLLPKVIAWLKEMK